MLLDAFLMQNLEISAILSETLTVKCFSVVIFIQSPMDLLDLDGQIFLNTGEIFRHSFLD